MVKKSRLFYSDEYKVIEKSIADLLNRQSDVFNQYSINNPRSVGGAIEKLLVDKFSEIIDSVLYDYKITDASRKSLGDFEFTDHDGFRYIVDVKTHRFDTTFNMPNLTSVRRLATLYENPSNYFVILKVDYSVDNLNVIVNKVTFVPIEFLSWDCLTLGALGWGQLQIKNANVVEIVPQNDRKDWMIKMCDRLISHYSKEAIKAKSRSDYFEKIKNSWLK